MRVGRWSKEMDYGEGSASAPGFPSDPEWFQDNLDFGNIRAGLERSVFQTTMWIKSWAAIGSAFMINPSVHNKGVFGRETMAEVKHDVDYARAPLREPSEVMRLERMGSFFPTRLSFMRTLTRRLAREEAKVTRPVFDTVSYTHLTLPTTPYV